MVGAETILRTLMNSEVDVCFANPGTSEMQFVAAIDRVPGMRAVLSLFEGVASGAADGYARMADKPAATLLHLGPGLTNAMANLHNARRAGSPMINLIGDHATFHAMHESPLASDVKSYAGALSAWHRSNSHASMLGRDTRDAIRAAWRTPGQVASLIVPADCSWNPGGDPGGGVARPTANPADPQAIEAAARALSAGERCAFLIDGAALRAPGLKAVARLQNFANAAFRSVTLPGRQERGGGLPRLERFPRYPQQAVEFLGQFDHLFLVGTPPPVAFFAYPDTPNWYTPEQCQLHALANADEDGVAALESLCDASGAPAFSAENMNPTPMSVSQGALTPDNIAAVVASLLPDQAIVSEEAVTSRGNLLDLTAHGPRHDWLSLTGGALGQGLACSLGAAIACPDRPVICLQADGAGMYNPQALWSMAREGADVTIVLYANRRYRILGNEFERLALGGIGPAAQQLLDIGTPELQWTQLAASMGVPATRVHDTDELHKAFAEAVAEPGPNLIEAMM